MAADILPKFMEDPAFIEHFWTKPFLRFMKHFPLKGDDELVILKGHLLIEVLLWEFVDDNVPNKDALEKLKKSHAFGFELLTHLAEALNQRDHFDWLWRAIRKLNKIRNGFAHNLEPKGIEDIKKDFIDFVQTNDSLPWTDTYFKEFRKLRLAIWGCHKHLQMLVEYESMMEAAKKFIPTLLGEGAKPKDEKGG
jgi:hypothetical protein